MTYLLIYLFALHLIGDFYLMQRWMVGKSWAVKQLTIHAIVYGSVLWIGLSFTGRWPLDKLNLFCFFNACAHLVTDIVSTKLQIESHRIHSPYHQSICFGTDQFVHAVCLIISMEKILN